MAGVVVVVALVVSHFFFLKILFIHERDGAMWGEAGRDTGRGRSRLHGGSLIRDLIPGRQDQALG